MRRAPHTLTDVIDAATEEFRAALEQQAAEFVRSRADAGIAAVTAEEVVTSCGDGIRYDSDTPMPTEAEDRAIDEAFGVNQEPAESSKLAAARRAEREEREAEVVAPLSRLDAIAARHTAKRPESIAEVQREDDETVTKFCPKGCGKSWTFARSETGLKRKRIGGLIGGHAKGCDGTPPSRVAAEPVRRDPPPPVDREALARGRTLSIKRPETGFVRPPEEPEDDVA